MKKIISIIILLFIIQHEISAQSWNLYGINTCGGLEKIGGSSASSSPLEIHMDGPYSIEFYTNAVKHMELTSAGDLTVTGNIITNNTIKLSNITSAFQIGSVGVLWFNGNPTNIYIGDGAGFKSTSADASNVLIGHNAGYNQSTFDNVIIGDGAGYFNGSGGTNGADKCVFIGKEAGYKTDGSVGLPTGDIYIGYKAGYTGTSAGENCFVGYQTGILNTASLNTFIGYNAGSQNVGGASNAFVGASSGASNTSGERNTFVGAASGNNNSTGSDNCYIGYGTVNINSNSVGNNNNFLGSNSGASEINGSNNEQIGYKAGYANKNGSNNVLIGSNAGDALGIATTESDNVFIGHNSGAGLTSVHDDILIGSNSAVTPTNIKSIAIGSNSIVRGSNSTSTGDGTSITGDNSLALGSAASVNGTNATAVGFNAIVKNSNQMILGDNSVNVGIGLSNNITGPRSKLEINSNINNISGLQFTKLVNPNSIATTTSTSGQNVLSVDQSGKVILVADQGFPSITSTNTNTLQINQTGNNFQLTVPQITLTSTNNLITSSGTYPNFNITDNLSLSSGTPSDLSITGSSPNFVINNLKPNIPVSLTSGASINITGTYPSFIVNNTAPDQTVTLTGLGGVTTSGTYPNFTITGGGSGSVSTQNGTSLFGNSTVEFGQSLATPQNPGRLIHNTEIPMIDDKEANQNKEYNIYFTGQKKDWFTNNLANIGIGYPSLTGSNPTTLQAKLDVVNQTQFFNYTHPFTNQNAARFITESFPSTSYLTYAMNFNGVYGESRVVSTLSTLQNIGGMFLAKNAGTNIGLKAVASNLTNSFNNYGVYGIGYNANNNSFGVLGESGGSRKNNFAVRGNVYCYESFSGSNNYAIYGEAKTSITCPGKNNLSSFWAGYFDGKVQTTSATYLTSDSIFKKNVIEITGDSARQILNKLNVKGYIYDTTNFPSISLPQGSQVGLISQEVQRVLPNLVSETVHPAVYDSLGNIINEEIHYKSLNYTGLIPILIAGVKQLNNNANGSSNGISISGNNQYEWGSSPLNHTTELNLNGNNIYFSDNDNTDNNIGVGHAVTESLEAKLDVINDCADASNLMAGKFLNTGSCAGGNTLKGVLGSTDVMDNHTNIGGDFSAYNGRVNIGVRATIDGTIKPTNPNEPNADVAPGGYAIYGDAGNSTNFWAGYFNGYVGTTCGWYQASDGKLKENVKQLSVTGSRKIINQLRPSTYTFKTEDQKAMNLPSGNQYGLIAEDVEKVMPELVREMSVPARLDKNGKVISGAQTFKGVNYVGMIPVLISAIQQMDSTNSKLLERLEKQQKQIDALQNCCNFHSTVSSETPKGNVIDLSDLTIILDQNSPNPFAEQTTITYTIPESIKDAKIMFYTVNGVVLKTVQITDRNHGSLTVYGSNLSEGIYTYTLIADGKIIDSKKMICAKK